MNSVQETGPNEEPAPKLGGRYTALAFLLGVVSVLPFFLHYSAGVDDEALSSLPATRVLEGEVPYRDFETRPNPGTIYLLALLYRVFGASFASTRLLMVLCSAGLALVVFQLGRKVLPGYWPLLPLFLWVTTGVSHFAVVNHHWTSTLGALLTLWMLGRWLDKPEPRRTVPLGLGLAFTWWSLQSDGGAIGLVTVVAGLTRWRSDFWRNAAALVTTFVVASVLLWAPVWTRVDAPTIVQQSMLEPLSYHVGWNTSPYTWEPLRVGWSQILSQLPQGLGNPSWLLHSLSYLGVWTVKYGLYYVVLFLAVVAALVKMAKSKDLPTYLVLVLGCLVVLTIVHGERQDMLYINYLNPLWFILLGWLLQQLKGGRYLAGGLVLLFGVQYAFSYVEARGHVYPVVTRRGTLTANSPQVASYLNALYRRVSQLSPPGEFLLAFPYEPALPFATATRSVLRPPILMPIHYPESVLEEAIADVERLKPPYIYYSPVTREALSAYPTVDAAAYLEAQDRWVQRLTEGYAVQETLGPTVIYVRTTPSRPAADSQPSLSTQD